MGWWWALPVTGRRGARWRPYLRETLRSGHAGAVYDYKSPTLERRLHFEASQMRPRAGRLMPAIRTLNMVDARCSHRFDLLSTIRTPLHAQELAGTIITGGRTHRDSSDFFNQAAAEYLSSILCYYAVRHAGPEPVTLPHMFAILLAHETEDIRRYHRNPRTRYSVENASLDGSRQPGSQ